MTPAIARAEVAAARAMGWYATTWDTIGAGRKNGAAAPQVAAQSRPEGDLRRAILLQLAGGEIVARRIAKALDRHKSTIQVRLRGFIRDGLVVARDVPDPCRKASLMKVYSLTDAGRAEMEALL